MLKQVIINHESISRWIKYDAKALSGLLQKEQVREALKPFGKLYDRLQSIVHFKEQEERAQRIGVAKLIPFCPLKTKEQVLEKFAQDENLNNVPLVLWDAKGRKEGKICECCKQVIRKAVDESEDLRDSPVCKLALASGIKSWSWANTTCVLKHVARHHIGKLPMPPIDEFFV